MDPLSDALQACRFTGVVFIDAELSAPWAITTPSAAEIAAALGADLDLIVPYHLVAEGRCWLSAGEEVRELVAGDVALFPFGRPHSLGSDRDLVPTVLSRAFVDEVLRRSKVVPIRHGGGGPSTHLLCGFFALDKCCGAHLIGALPQVLVTHVGTPATKDLLVAAARRSIEARQAGGPATEALVRRLSEFLFTDALRNYLAAAEGPLTGWLAGLRDPAVAKVLALLHSRPRQKWDLRRLAAACAMSRTNCVSRFSEVVGVPPMSYLARWRMILAASELRAKNSSVMQVAGRYGYASEASFTRAFQRIFAIPPARYRRAERAAREPVA